MLRNRLLVAAALLALPVAAQAGLLVNEVATGTVDWIEVVNLGPASVNLSGYRLYAAWGTTTLGTSNSTLFGSVTLNSGQALVVTETSNLATPVTAAGTIKVYSGFAIGYSTTGTGGVSGVATLVNPSNAGVDTVSWGPAANTFAFGSPFTGTPFNPTAQNFGRNSNTDTNAASNWVALGTTSPCALNPGQSDPNSQITLTISSTLGSFDLLVTTQTAVPFGEIYNLVSLVDSVPDGSGPVFGVGIDSINSALSPADPFNPFHTYLDAAGMYALSAPQGSIPAGIHIEMVTLLVGAGGITRISPVRVLTF